MNERGWRACCSCCCGSTQKSRRRTWLLWTQTRELYINMCVGDLTCHPWRIQRHREVLWGPSRGPTLVYRIFTRDSHMDKWHTRSRSREARQTGHSTSTTGEREGARYHARRYDSFLERRWDSIKSLALRISCHETMGERVRIRTTNDSIERVGGTRTSSFSRHIMNTKHACSVAKKYPYSPNVCRCGRKSLASCVLMKSDAMLVCLTAKAMIGIKTSVCLQVVEQRDRARQPATRQTITLEPECCST